MKRLLLLIAILCVAVGPVLANTASKTGAPIANNPGTIAPPSTLRADFEYNTCGQMDCVPNLGGSATGWGEWFIVTIQNTTGHDLWVKEFGFPCCGYPTSQCGWIVWTNVGGNHAPFTGDGCTADLMGQFTPVDPNPGTFPPTTYTYINVESANICIPLYGAFLWFFLNARPLRRWMIMWPSRTRPIPGANTAATKMMGVLFLAVPIHELMYLR